MRRTRNLLGGLVSLAVTGVFLVVLVLFFRAQGEQPQVAQQPYPVATATVPALPLPTTPTPQPYPPPTSPTPPRATLTPLVTATPPPPVPTLVAIPVPPEILAGEKIAFVKDKNLQILNVASRALASATASANVTALFGWSWDGTKLLLGVGEGPTRPETDMMGGSDLWILDIQQGKAVQITQGLQVQSATWSPVNHQIAYGTRDLDIYIVNSDGTGRRKLLTNSYLGPWSPDGTQLVYRELNNDTVSLSVFNITEESGRQLASDEIDFVGYLWSLDVQWSLNGSELLFQSRRGEPGTSIWWKIDIDSRRLIHLDNETLRTIRAFSEAAPRSPVADRVVFSVYDSDFNEIVWTMDFKGNVQEVVKGSAPAWSPDGNRIVYMRKDNGLWIVNLDGTDAIKLSDLAGRPPYCWSH